MEDKETLNLDKLESQLDDALAKETKESLTNWLDGKRNKETPEEDKNGTIIQFLCGSHSYEGVWFGDKNPNREGNFWWRSILQEQEKNKFSEEDMIVFGNKMQLVSDVDFDGNVKFAFNPSEAIKQFYNK